MSRAEYERAARAILRSRCSEVGGLKKLLDREAGARLEVAGATVACCVLRGISPDLRFALPKLHAEPPAHAQIVRAAPHAKGHTGHHPPPQSPWPQARHPLVTFGYSSVGSPLYSGGHLLNM